MKILVVEDDANLRQLLEFVLRRDGVECFLAKTKQEALDSMKRERPDVILLDIWLNDGFGMEIVHQARTLFNPIPRIIVCTGYPGAKKYMDESIICSLLQKPFLLEELENIIFHPKDTLTQSTG